jgi:hypothetical protein
MKVFVGFGYNDRDKWIKELIIPFLRALNCEVETGEDMHGEILSEGVITRIKASDACIGFLTKRDPMANGQHFTTHSWVISELANAVTLEIPIFEIREKGVDPQAGETGDRQRYEFEDRALLMLEIAKFVNKVKSKLAYKTFMLLPPEFSDEIRKYAKFAKCTYTFLYKAKEYKPEETKLVRMQGGYGIIIKEIPGEEAQVEINIESPDGNWSSGYVSVGLMNVNLEKR